VLLAAQPHRRVALDQRPRLGLGVFADHDLPRHDQRLGPRARVAQLALDQQRVQTRLWGPRHRRASPYTPATPGATCLGVPSGLSIPTSVAASLQAPGWMKQSLQPPLEWLASSRDGPLLTLLGMVLVACGLGLWWRRKT
jgi:hypothetical protein